MLQERVKATALKTAESPAANENKLKVLISSDAKLIIFIFDLIKSICYDIMYYTVLSYFSHHQFYMKRIMCIK